MRREETRELLDRVLRRERTVTRALKALAREQQALKALVKAQARFSRAVMTCDYAIDDVIMSESESEQPRRARIAKHL